jgi:hypothetical protein
MQAGMNNCECVKAKAPRIPQIPRILMMVENPHLPESVIISEIRGAFAFMEASQRD